MAQRILFALSWHGYGHLGQAAPVIQALTCRKPEIEIIVRSGIPEFKLREKLGDGIQIQSANLDIGMIQKDALNIDFDKTAHKYDQFHNQWEALLESEKSDLLKISPDLIVANIPYLTLAAGQQLNVPTIAFSSLNWAELYQYYFEKLPESNAILKQMLNAYNQAFCFLQPSPSMNMPGIENGIPIGPVAHIGENVSDHLRAKLDLNLSEILVLVSLGGMELKTTCDNWPRFPGVRFLVPESWNSRHPDTIALEALGYPFSDLMRSSDLLITKPGYGSFVEAACTGTPVLYLPRKKWPEAPILIDWLKKKGSCKEISLAEFQTGNLYNRIQEVVTQGKTMGIAPSGVREVIDKICEYL